MSQVVMKLRLESRNGSPAKEYRIEGGNVEVRTLDRESDDVSVWSRLTPEQMSIHVKRNTVVASWLESRLGWRRLLQACVGEEPRTRQVAENTDHASLKLDSDPWVSEQFTNF
jgi:hypothetical protein